MERKTVSLPHSFVLPPQTPRQLSPHIGELHRGNNETLGGIYSSRSTRLKVSRLCLGTGNFGSGTAEADSHAILDKTLDMGVNFIDTANVYGGGMGEGLSEQIIGRWFAQGGGRREKTILATKVWGVMGEWPNESKLSALHIRRACESSLRRLQTDSIDLYQMHHIDRETPWEEIWQAMEQLVREGKILYVGSSNFAAWHIAQANDSAWQRHFLGLVSEQALYNLKSRMIELEVIPACRDYGMGLLPWSPLASGILGGAFQKAAEGHRAAERQIHAVEKHRSQLERYEAFCDEIGEKPAPVALAWVLSNPVVTAPIVGPRTMEQLVDCLHALEVRLTEEQKKALDDIWPGGSTSRQAYYAW
jgi:aryl-alcohol dehydrogenase-like predicted oxidoreductase